MAFLLCHHSTHHDLALADAPLKGFRFRRRRIPNSSCRLLRESQFELFYVQLATHYESKLLHQYLLPIK